MEDDMAAPISTRGYKPVKHCHHCGQRLPRERQTVAERFWEKVDIRTPIECWEWLASISVTGYGTFMLDKKTHGAHRIAYELHFGTRLTAQEHVCHKCDNPRCVNPHHLFVGTHHSNMRDMKAKGRHKQTPQLGERHWNAKLTAPDIIAIRASALTAAQLAERFGVTDTMIRLIRQRRNWRHI
jgi:hypothetical protein